MQTETRIGPEPVPRPQNGHPRTKAPVEGGASGLTGLLRELSEETAAYVQAEVALAKREAEEKIEDVRAGAIQLAVSAVICGLGLWALTAALIFGIATEIPLWASALIVGAAILVIGGIVLMVGKKKLESQNLEPERTMRSLHQTKAMAKEHFR